METCDLDKRNAVRKKYTRFLLDKKIFTAPESERVGQKEFKNNSKLA